MVRPGGAGLPRRESSSNASVRQAAVPARPRPIAATFVTSSTSFFHDTWEPFQVSAGHALLIRPSRLSVLGQATTRRMVT